MNRLLVAALAGAVSLSACAQDRAPAPPVAATAVAQSAQPDPDAEARVREALGGLVPDVKIDSIKAAPMPGFREVVTSGQVVYVSDDGRLLMQGSVFEIATRTDLTERSRAGIRKAVLDGVGPEQRIIFAPQNPTYRVTVFTDIDCGYCRRMHQEMAEYNALGISIEYLFFPRAGIGSESFEKAVSVWCADNRLQAMTDAKNGLEMPVRNCVNPVTRDYDLGQRIGVDGTPAAFTEDGVQVGGYLPPRQLLQRLEQNARRNAER